MSCVLRVDGQLLYTFLSLAATRDAPEGGIVPVDGMKLIAALAHKYGVPVTWVIDSQSVQASKDLLLRGHREHGDDVILLIDIPRFLKEAGVVPASEAEEIVVLRQKLPQFVISERAKIKEALPWAEVNVIAADTKTDALVQILEELDCIGLWGYRWGREPEHRENEASVQPEGCPWSFFYASGDHYNAPAQHAGGLVAVESTSLDLNAAFYSGNLKVFSAAPSALRMSGLYADKDMDYPKMLLDEYLKNCLWNRFVIFLQQQPAYEMEYRSYDTYDKGTISEMADILDRYFYEAAYNPDIQAFSLPEAIELYKKEFEYTESCYMVFDGLVPLQAEVDFYVPPEPKQKPPYPLTFFYYDHECQLIFKEGQMTPTEMRNYFRPPFESKHFFEKEMPSISAFRPTRERDKLIMEFEIESIKQMPFGLVIWDDHSMFSLVSTNARLVKWIGNYLLFMRMDLEEGLNRVEISLAI